MGVNGVSSSQSLGNTRCRGHGDCLSQSLRWFCPRSPRRFGRRGCFRLWVSNSRKPAISFAGRPIPSATDPDGSDSSPLATQFRMVRSDNPTCRPSRRPRPSCRPRTAITRVRYSRSRNGAQQAGALFHRFVTRRRMQSGYGIFPDNRARCRMARPSAVAVLFGGCR